MGTKRVSLGTKLVLILLPVVALYGAVDHMLQRAVLKPSFDQLELEHALRDLQQTEAAIHSEVELLAHLSRSHAVRPELRTVWGRSEDLARHGAGWMEHEGLDLAFLCDPNGHVLFGDARRPNSGEPLRLREFPQEQLAPTHVLLSSVAPRRAIHGLLDTEVGPMLVSSRPILTSEPDGELLGRVILGRMLDDDRMAALSERTRVPFRTWSLDGSNLPEAEHEVVDDVTASAAPIARVRSASKLQLYSTLDDVRAQPTILLRLDLDRNISERGASAIRYALLSTVAAGILMLLVLQRLIRHIVLQPLAQLTEHAEEIGRQDDADRRLRLERKDEIGTLANEFDRMLAKLAESRAAVVSAARQAGMSEIATGILHNVGNVLNSVCVSADVMEEKLENSRLSHLEKLCALLVSQRGDLARFVAEDPKGAQVVPFLEALTRQLRDEHSGMRDELRHLEEAVEHIRELITSQQAFAGRSTLLEPTCVAEQIEAALRLVAKVHGDRDGIHVDRRIEELPRLILDRHKLVEILVNLIQNARQAVHEAAPEQPRILVRALQREGWMRIEVEDNGCGIPPENLSRIFGHGFTTKKTGHGFGLHASANAAGELGGRLFAESEGAGKGSRFVLELPLRIANAA